MQNFIIFRERTAHFDVGARVYLSPAPKRDHLCNPAHCYRDLRLVDRSAAVKVAQTSKFVYRIALPILSRSLVVTENNEQSVAAFLDNRDACAHVEVLTIVDEQFLADEPEVFQRFAKLNEISAPSPGDTLCGRQRPRHRLVTTGPTLE